MGDFPEKLEMCALICSEVLSNGTLLKVKAIIRDKVTYLRLREEVTEIRRHGKAIMFG